MAIITPGPIIGAISGELAGTVFAYTNAGIVAKRTPVKTRSHSEESLRVQAALATIHAYWTSLSDSQHQAWNTAAALASSPNRLGTQRYMSGYNLFCTNNLNRMLSGETTKAIPPASLTREQPSAVWAHALSNGVICTTTVAPNGQDQVLQHVSYINRMIPQGATHFDPRGKRLGQSAANFPTIPWTTDATALAISPLAGEKLALGHAYTSQFEVPGKPLWAHCTCDDLPFPIESWESNSLTPAWTASGTALIQNTTVKEGTYALQLSITTNPYQSATVTSYQYLPLYPQRGMTFSTWLRYTAKANQPGIMFFFQDPSNFYYACINNVFNHLRLYRMLGGVLTQLKGVVEGTLAPNVWWRLDITPGLSGLISVYLYNAAGAFVNSCSATDTNFSNGTLRLFLDNQAGNTCDAYFDTIEVNAAA